MIHDLKIDNYSFIIKTILSTSIDNWKSMGSGSKVALSKSLPNKLIDSSKILERINLFLASHQIT